MYIALLVIGHLVLFATLAADRLMGRAPDVGPTEKLLHAGAIVLLVGAGFLLLLHRLRGRRLGPLSTPLPLGEAAVLAGMLAGVIALGVVHRVHPGGSSHGDWAIGIYRCENAVPTVFSDPPETDNPLITRDTIHDVPAAFVADPLLFARSDSLYMFFEVWNLETDEGDIGVAVSGDGQDWDYRGLVLSEDYTISFPCVFAWNDTVWMVPETRTAGELRLYRADDFPMRWSFDSTLIPDRRLRDPILFERDGSWWLFTVGDDFGDLLVFFADTPRGPWTPHPKNPVVLDDPDAARPGGNFVLLEDRVIRYAQDVKPYYGNQVWGFAITTLTRTDYVEEPLLDRPVLKGYEDWNTRGMHTLSPVPAPGGGWIAAVDGHGRQTREW